MSLLELFANDDFHPEKEVYSRLHFTTRDEARAAIFEFAEVYTSTVPSYSSRPPQPWS